MHNNLISASELRLSFHYSFILSGDVSDLLINYQDYGLKKIDVDGFDSYVTVDRSELSLEPADAYEQSTLTLAKNRNSRTETHSCTLNRHFHFDSTGASGYVVALNLKAKELDLETLLRLTSLGDNDSFEIKGSQSGRTWTNLESIFRSDLEGLIEVVGCHGVSIKWYEESEDFASQQHPYVQSVLYFDEQEKYNAFVPREGDFNIEADIGVEEAELRLKIFGALLFRWKSSLKDVDDVDVSYIRQARNTSHRLLANTHIHRDLFISANIRSCLVAANVSEESRDGLEVASYTLPAVERTISDIRAHWYAYLFFCAILEKDVQHISNFVFGSYEKLLLLLMSRKERLLRLLDVTVAHKLSSDTILSLHEHLFRLFRISTLRQQALDKLSLLDSLVSTTRQYSLVSARPNLGEVKDS